MTIDTSHEASPSEVVWACVEDGFYVASRGDAFLGFVDRVTPEMFQVCNAESQQIGVFPDIDAAFQCVLELAGTAPGLDGTE